VSPPEVTSQDGASENLGWGENAVRRNKDLGYGRVPREGRAIINYGVVLKCVGENNGIGGGEAIGAGREG